MGLAAVLLYLSLRGINWPRVGDVLRHASRTRLCLVAAVMSAAMFLRALRWRVLLTSGQTTGEPVSVPLVFRATAAGYLANNVLPARAGELIRAMMITREAGLSKVFVLTTALSERVADAIALIVCGATVLLAYPAAPDWLAKSARPFAALGLAGAAAIALVPVFEPLYYKILAALPFPASIRVRLEHVLGQVTQGLRSFHETGRLLRFAGLTAAIWLLDAVGAVVCASAVGLPIRLPVAFLLVAGMGLGSALPSTPGYIGIYQFVAVTILGPFGVMRSEAIAFSLLLQAVGYVVVLVWGLMALARRSRGALRAPVAAVVPSAARARAQG